MDKILKYKESLKVAWGYNDYNDWPIKFNSIMHLWIDDFSEELITDLKKVISIHEQKNIAIAFGNPSRIYRIIHSVILGMKKNKYSLEEQRFIARYMLELVEKLKVGSIFNENGENILIDIYDVYKNINFISAKNDDSKKLHAMFGLLWSYTESIFFRAHDVTKEIHGPYKMPDGSMIIIREYMNLRPIFIWDEVPLLDCNNIKIYSKYNNNFELNIDAYDHLCIKSGNMTDNLLEYSIIIDGKDSDLNCLYQKVGLITSTITAIHLWATASTWIDKTNRYADIYWYRKKPLKDLLKEDNWQVMPETRKKIKEGKIDERRLKKLTDKQIDFLINTLL